MNKNLSIVSQNNKLMLKKSKSLMSITNSILSKDDWMQRLWDWADNNDISSSELTKINNDGSIRGLARDKKKLLNHTKLDFSEFQLSRVPEEIGNLIKLKTLRLEENKLTHIPVSIGNLTSLEFLGLWENKLVTLPVEIGNLINLKELHIDDNQFTIVPKEIWHLINLTSLHLGWNLFRTIPNEIGKLMNLTFLGLGGNNLAELPKEIGNLINLTELNIRANSLTELPKEIVNLTNLSIFDFEDNENLILTASQIEWLQKLIKNKCDVTMNDRYHGEFELQRRYKYLDEFNIGRAVPITPKILDNDIPSRIVEKLAESEVTFEEFLDEVSEYLDREKFNTLVQKLYDRSHDLGTSFEHNVSFVSFVDNKLTWTSTAFGEGKKLLITHWGLINMFVKDTFGFETKIINIAVSVE